jgi:hypothetical protein
MSCFVKLEIPRVEKKISLSAAYSAGRILETVHKLIIPNKEPVMTRFLAEQLAKSHYFSHEAAHRDFGYTPHISIEEGMDKLLLWLKTSVNTFIKKTIILHLVAVLCFFGGSETHGFTIGEEREVGERLILYGPLPI